MIFDDEKLDLSKVTFKTTKNQGSKDQNLANNAKISDPRPDKISIEQVIKNVKNYYIFKFMLDF